MTDRSRTTLDGRSSGALADGFRDRGFAAPDAVRRDRTTTPRRRHPTVTDPTRSPTAPDDRTDAHTTGASTEDEDPVALLHVEPDERSAELLTAFAERIADGSTVRSVDGMAAALAAADAVDRVVTEQRLPDGSGIELVERLRARGSDVPVAFHTTCRGAETEARTLDAGADAYFAKRPECGQYDRLLERLRGLVGGDDARNTRAAATVSSDEPEAVAERGGAEE